MHDFYEEILKNHHNFLRKLDAVEKKTIKEDIKPLVSKVMPAEMNIITSTVEHMQLK